MLSEVDILKEVGNIAAGHGAIALSEVLGKKIMLQVPSMEIISCEKGMGKIEKDKIGIAIFSRMIVGLRGEMAFILDEKNAFKLIDLSYKLQEDDKQTGVLTEMGLSLIKEIGNIVVGAYSNALSLMLKRMVVCPAPMLISGSIDEILKIILSHYGREEYTYLIKAVFTETGHNIKGSFYLVLTPGAVNDIKESCKKMLTDIAEE